MMKRDKLLNNYDFVMNIHSLDMHILDNFS